MAAENLALQSQE